MAALVRAARIAYPTAIVGTIEERVFVQNAVFCASIALDCMDKTKTQPMYLQLARSVSQSAALNKERLIGVCKAAFTEENRLKEYDIKATVFPKDTAELKTEAIKLYNSMITYMLTKRMIDEPPAISIQLRIYMMRRLFEIENEEKQKVDEENMKKKKPKKPTSEYKKHINKELNKRRKLKDVNEVVQQKELEEVEDEEEIINEEQLPQQQLQFAAQIGADAYMALQPRLDNQGVLIPASYGAPSYVVDDDILRDLGALIHVPEAPDFLYDQFDPANLE